MVAAHQDRYEPVRWDSRSYSGRCEVSKTRRVKCLYLELAAADAPHVVPVHEVDHLALDRGRGVHRRWFIRCSCYQDSVSQFADGYVLVLADLLLLLALCNPSVA